MSFYLTLAFILWTTVGCQSSPSTLVHNSKHNNLQLSIHGHRGSRGTHPENTIAALSEAANADITFLELDLTLSKEGIPVLSHEPVISADLCLDSNKKPLLKIIPVRSLTLKQIKSFDCGSVPNPQFPEQQSVPNSSIPTLEEVLVWLKQTQNNTVHLNIETKMIPAKQTLELPPKAFTGSVINLLKKYGMIERSVLQSFDFRTLRWAKTLAPHLRLSALFASPSDICTTTKNLGANIASPQFSWLTSDMVKECHALGIEVHPYTLNDETDWNRALQLGVDGIITDYPRKLKQYLLSKS
ncbi:MAG: hypothetical protein EBQ85_10935 [Proteobacteria bacterium]|nr:hypothetical protein [Pseudomonadota bacterium]